MPSSQTLSDDVGEDMHLESQQAGIIERQRSLAEGDDAHLIELAAAPPVAEDPQNDSLEREESKAEQSLKHNHNDQDGDEFLTEVAVPAPLDAEGEQPRSDEQGAASTRQNSSSEVLNHGKESSDAVDNKEHAALAGAGRTARIWTEIVIISWLVLFSILGTLARLGVEALTLYPNTPFASTVLWANLGGSLFLGFLLEDRRLFRYTADSGLLEGEKEDLRQHVDKQKKILPLYIGLATGFCGSFTSFSTFITDAFLALSNSLAGADPTSPYHTVGSTSIHARDGGYSFMAVVAILIIQPGISIGALKTGAHLAVGLEPLIPGLPVNFIRHVLDPIAVILGFGCWLGAVFLNIWPIQTDWRYQVTMALVFAPPGTLLRFYLSKRFNARVKGFPLGTFAVNIIGTCIEGMCYDLQHTSSIVGVGVLRRVNPCAILEGVMQGFCGCTTTVSTWVAELVGLRRRHAWLYGLTSIGTALGFQIAIMGSVAWTAGFANTCAT